MDPVYDITHKHPAEHASTDTGTIKHGRDFPLQKDAVLAADQAALFGQIEWYHGSNFASIDSNVYRGFLLYKSSAMQLNKPACLHARLFRYMARQATSRCSTVVRN